MRRHRCARVIVLFVFVAAIAAPVFAGGNDAPAVPPAGHNKNQTASSRVWHTERLGWFAEILSVIWGGGAPKPRH